MQPTSKRDGPPKPEVGRQHDRPSAIERSGSRRDYAAGADGDQDIDVEAAGGSREESRRGAPRRHVAETKVKPAL